MGPHPHELKVIKLQRAQIENDKFESTFDRRHEEHSLLLFEWIAYFWNESFPILNTGGGENDEGGISWICNSATDNSVRVEFQDYPKSKKLSVRTVGICSSSHAELIENSTRNTNLGLGRILCWYATVDAPKPNPFDQSTQLQFFRGLEHARRLTGKIALGRDVILDFASHEHPTDTPAVFLPVNASLYFTLRSPYPGPLATKRAVERLPNIVACISFCIGTPLRITNHRAAADQQVADLNEALGRQGVPQLAADGVAVGEILGFMHAAGADEAAHRVYRAMACFETAMHQRSLSAAVIHLASAIEALARPNYAAAWHVRVTKRYKDFLIACAKEKMEATLKHPNFSSAFPEVKNINQLANSIYGSRSAAVHSGFPGEYHDSLGGKAGIRVGLIADIVRSTVIDFLQRPFTSLVGHPMLDPIARIDLDSALLYRLRQRASREGLSVEDCAEKLLRAHADDVQ